MARPRSRPGLHHHVDHRDTAELGLIVRLREVAGDDARTEPPGTAVIDRLTREQPEEVALAGAVRAEHRDALAEPDLGVERIGEPVQLELLAHDHPLAGAIATQPHRHRLLADAIRRRGRLEPFDLRLRRPHTRRELVAAHRRPAAELLQ